MPPVDYRLLLPTGWFRLRIDPEGRERSVDALLDRKFEGTDDAPHIKRQLREELLAQATAAFQDGAIELYLSMQQAGPLTIPASLLVTLLPPPSGGLLPNTADLAASLAADKGAHVSIVELSAGRAVRRRVTRGPSDRPVRDGVPVSADPVLPSVALDFQIPVPRTDAHLLLSFSTPLVQIADPMVELFDAVAGSLTWVGGGSDDE
ncbi:hypothetical protein [Streptomyces coeruleorubidus]|uniref:hypothetical protein n=1 Tax=Streptomyces coeruleorubidus TaxID=116188 RepID=UPI0033E6D079